MQIAEMNQHVIFLALTRGCLNKNSKVFEELVLRCIHCGTDYRLSKNGIDKCPHCQRSVGVPSALEISNLLRIAKISSVEKLGFNPFDGWATKLQNYKGNVYAVHAGQSLTGSVKDRATTVAIVAAKIFDMPKITVASCGNAAVSLAAAGRRFGIETHIHVASDIDSKYIDRLNIEGAVINASHESYKQAFDYSIKSAEVHNDIYSRNTGVNALTRIGKSTLWNAISKIKDFSKEKINLIVPYGDGNLLSSLLVNNYLLSRKERFNIHVCMVGNGEKITQYKFDPINHRSDKSKIGPLSVKRPSDNYLAEHLTSVFNSVLYWNLPDNLFSPPDILINGQSPCWIYGGLAKFVNFLQEDYDLENIIIPITAINWR